MELDRGAKSWDEIEKDKHQYNFQPSFPSPSPAKTTFYAREADDEAKFDRLWALHHGRGHTYEEWDRQRVRAEDEFKYRRACVILSQVGVSEDIRQWTLERLMKENLTGFSRYYEGIDGAAIGFASLYRYDTESDALNSTLVTRAEELLQIDGTKLIEYVWDKYDSPASSTPPPLWLTPHT